MSIENKNQPAYPVMMQQVGDNEYRAAKPKDEARYNVPMAGLSKREYIAAKVLPACVDLFSPDRPDAVAQLAVRYADALLAELEK